MAGTRQRVKPGSPRRAARLAAAQALYRIELSETGAAEVLAEIGEGRTGGMLEPGLVLAADTELLTRLVAGVSARRAELDGLIDETLKEGWTAARLEILLRIILRAGAFELLACPETPARVVVAEQVDVAHAFYDARETGLANGVLDRLAHRLRPAEMESPGDAAAAPSE